MSPSPGPCYQDSHINSVYELIDSFLKPFEFSAIVFAFLKAKNLASSEHNDNRLKLCAGI